MSSLWLDIISSRLIKTTLFVTVVFLLIAGIITIAVVNKYRPTAQENDTLPSSITVQISENGVPAYGIVRFGGDCGTEYFPTQDGGVACSLEAATKKSSGTDYEINGITFQSFSSKQVFSLPLQSRLAGLQPIYVPPSRQVSLSVSIVGDVISMKIVKNGTLVELPAETGLQTP